MGFGTSRCHANEVLSDVSSRAVEGLIQAPETFQAIGVQAGESLEGRTLPMGPYRIPGNESIHRLGVTRDRFRVHVGACMATCYMGLLLVVLSTRQRTAVVWFRGAVTREQAIFQRGATAPQGSRYNDRLPSSVGIPHDCHALRGIKFFAKPCKHKIRLLPCRALLLNWRGLSFQPV